MTAAANRAEELLDRVEHVGGLILGVTENRGWIKIFYEGDGMHTKTVDLPAALRSEMVLAPEHMAPAALQGDQGLGAWSVSEARACI